MSRNQWQEQDLLAVARDTPLANLAKNLGYDLEKWIPTATTSLPETLRVTKARHDREWTESLLRELGGAPLPWAEGDFAWQMPFARGQAPDERSKYILSLLHESGRITRQEAASMLPVVVLNPQPGQLILDLCAAPGSKATQVAEAVAPNGVVVANEPVSGRVNMLVSNRGRLSTSNMLINQQDGRHIGRIPPPGYDGIVADVPCTGSATSRKNRNVWWKWSPKESRTLFRLQVEITTRGASLLRPGGHLVYSTCSIDPCENEAVVAQLLRQLPYLELVDIDESKLKGLKLREGLSDWDVLDKESNPLPRGDEVPRTTFLQPVHMSPAARRHWMESVDEDIDEKLEMDIEAQLSKCRRLIHHDNDTGGFFVAMFRHRPEATPEGIARTFIRRRQPEGTFHPLKLIHAGLPAFTKKRGDWRSRQEAVPALYPLITASKIVVAPETLQRLLTGWAPLLEDYNDEFEPIAIDGPLLLSCELSGGEELISAWAGARLTLMMDEKGRDILRLKLAMPFQHEEEEE